FLLPPPAYFVLALPRHRHPQLAHVRPRTGANMDDSNSQPLELRQASSGRGCGQPMANGTRQLKDPLKKARGRPRTYPYFKLLPYELETEAERQRNLDEILKYLYIAVEAGDFSLGVVHWTRELR